MPFPRSLPDPGEDRGASVSFRDRADQFHDEDRLANASTTEHRRLAAAGERRKQIDHLDPAQERLGRGCLLGKVRRPWVNRRQRSVSRQRPAAVDRFADDVDQASEDGVAHWNPDWTAGVAHFRSAGQPGRLLDCDASHHGRVKMVLHLEYEPPGPLPADVESIVDTWQLPFRKPHVDYGARDLQYPSNRGISRMHNRRVVLFAPSDQCVRSTGNGECLITCRVMPPIKTS